MLFGGKCPAVDPYIVKGAAKAGTGELAVYYMEIRLSVLWTLARIR